MAFWVTLAIVLAVEVVAYLILPKPKAPKPEAARDLEVPTAEAGRPAPVPFGTIMCKSPNVLWYGENSTRRFEV